MQKDFKEQQEGDMSQIVAAISKLILKMKGDKLIMELSGISSTMCENVKCALLMPNRIPLDIVRVH